MQGLALHARKRHLGLLVGAEGRAARGLVRRAARVRERFVFPVPVRRLSGMSGLR